MHAMSIGWRHWVKRSSIYLALFEKVGQELHGVHTHDRHILVGSRVLNSKSLDTLIDIFFDLESDLHTCEDGKSNMDQFGKMPW